MSATETRTRLLETALDLIWQSNYNSVGVNEICKQAGVTKGSFYHHFESKLELFCEATSYHWHNMKKELDPVFSPSNSALQRLEGFIQYILENKLGPDPADIHGCPFLGGGGQCGTGEDRIQAVLQDLSNKAIKYNLALVRSLADEGYVDDHQDPEQLARLLHQYIQGLMHYGQVHGDCNCVRRDLAVGMYRLLGLKREFWFSAQTPGTAAPDTLHHHVG